MGLPQGKAETGKLTTLAATLQRGQGLAVLVLGMHRSGTSAVAGVLNLLGVPIPGYLMLPDETNRKGYFEDERIVAFNDRLLEEFGSRWDDPVLLERECLRSAAAQSAARELAEFLRAEFRDRPAVLVKDPRLCRLLPIWMEALSQADRQIAAVLPLRHPLEVAASLERRDSLSRAHALTLWLQQVLAAERESRSLPRCFILFDDLLRDWRLVVRKIGDTLGYDWPRDPEGVGNEIDAFLSSELRHHHSAREDLDGHDALHVLCSRAWVALNSPAVGAAAQAVLDEIKRELDAALHVLSPLIASLDRKAADREQKLSAEIARREHLEELARAEIVRHEDLEHRFRHGMARRDAYLDSLEAQLDAVLSSTVWRATEPLRSAARRLPPPARRALRGAAKLLWWALTLRLLRKLAQRRHNVAAAEASPPQPGAEEDERREADVTGDAAPTVASPIALPYRGLLELMAAPTIAKAVERLKRFPLFSADDYIRRNPDVGAGPIDPYTHLLCFGAFDGRRCFRQEQIARVMAAYISGGEPHAGPAEADRSRAKDETEIARLASQSPPIGIYVSVFDNIFMKEIAEDLAADLRGLGVTVSLGDELSSIEDRPPISIFVAVDEFFWEGPGRAWIREKVIADSFMFQVEQIQTSWFARGLPLLLLSRGVIDISFQTADLLRSSGLPAFHFSPRPPPNSCPLMSKDYFDPLFLVLPAAAKAAPEPQSPFAERPLDIVFFGVASPHRAKFFARHAAFLSDYETFIHCCPDRGPITSGRGALTRLAAHACGHAKISLNVHEEEFPYFEWHRIVRLGMSSGSVVVSEPCLPHPDFKPGVHYFEENARHIPDLLEWLLQTEEGRREAERMRDNVNALIFDEARKRQNAARLLEFLLEHRAS